MLRPSQQLIRRRIRKAWTAAVPRVQGKRPTRTPIIRMSKFGQMGRFGNQLFQYAYARIMAEKQEAKLELPDWVGQELFGLPACSISSRVLPRRRKEQALHGNHLDFKLGFTADLRDAEVIGYFQYHTSNWRPYRDEWREWYQPVPAVLERVQPAEKRLREAGRTVIGLHYRRGDYGVKCFPITPIAWYRTWLELNWRRFDAPVLFIASEDPAIFEELAEWRPASATSLGAELVGSLSNYHYKPYDHTLPAHLDFYPDFHLLRSCDVLLIPNSTFSFCASMLGSPRECWRSSLLTGGFVAYSPWNSIVLQHQRVEDFPGLPGIRATDY